MNKVYFDKHIYEMCVKAGRQLNVLKGLSMKLSEDSSFCVFHTLWSIFSFLGQEYSI